jgi:putative transposase
MKRRRHTPEQIIRKLREADRLLGEGQEIPEVAKQLEVSEATYHRWRPNTAA